MTEIFSSERTFQFWSYTVSHRQLLLRSNPARGHNTRIELLFKAVEFLAIPPVIDGIKVIQLDSLDSDVGVLAAPKNIFGLWYRFDSKIGPVGLVAAGFFMDGQDTLDYYAPSTLLRGVDC